MTTTKPPATQATNGQFGLNRIRDSFVEIRASVEKGRVNAKVGDISRTRNAVFISHHCQFSITPTIESPHGHIVVPLGRLSGLTGSRALDDGGHPDPIGGLRIRSRPASSQSPTISMR